DHHIMNGLIRNFRICSKQRMGIKWFKRRRDAYIFIISLRSLLQKIIDRALLTKPANIPTVVLNCSWTGLLVILDMNPIWNSAYAITVGIIGVGKFENDFIRNCIDVTESGIGWWC